MRIFKYPFCTCMAAVMLASCGALQPTGESPAAMPWSSVSAGYVGQHRPPMSLQARNNDLLYVSNESGDVFYYTYPGGRFVGSIQDGGRSGLCSDSRGDVFIVDDYTQEIQEYPHGSNDMTNTLDDYGNYPYGCSVDPTTGDLAVAGGIGKSTANIAIYKSAQGLPAFYMAPSLFSFYYCTYDEQGNLFIEGEDNHRHAVLAELAKNGASLSIISLNRELSRGAAAIEWDGTYLAVAVPKKTAGPTDIYQVRVSGHFGTVVNTIELRDGGDLDRHGGASAQFWLQGNTIIEPKVPVRGIGLWSYPAGGRPKKLIRLGNARAWGITVSLASFSTRCTTQKITSDTAARSRPSRRTCRGTTAL